MTTEEIPAKAKEVRLAARPDGALTLAAFEVVEVEVPEPAEGEVVVRTDYLQLTAVMQDLMKPEPNLPMPGYQVGETLWGGGVGTVVASNSPDLAVGDTVQNMGGFRAYTVGPAGEHWKLDPTAFPSPLHHLTQGVTAYHGIVDIAEVKDGDTVFVSGAAGGVGSLAGQIAKLQGAKRVIGAAGSKAKVEYLVNTLGYDAAFDYHDGPVVDRLRELAPDGIDVFFDTVGGEQFEAAVQAAAPNARFALCGALAGQVGEVHRSLPAARRDDVDRQADLDPPVLDVPHAGADLGVELRVRRVDRRGPLRAAADARRGRSRRGSAGAHRPARREVHRKRRREDLICCRGGPPLRHAGVPTC